MLAVSAVLGVQVGFGASALTCSDTTGALWRVLACHDPSPGNLLGANQAEQWISQALSSRRSADMGGPTESNPGLNEQWIGSPQDLPDWTGEP